MVPQFLILHLYPHWPEAESEALQEEVRHVGAAGQDVMVYVEVIADVIAHAIDPPLLFSPQAGARAGSNPGGNAGLSGRSCGSG